MEDISRELEREIARAKPSPHKTSRKKKILIVDDFGEFRSGGYLTVLVYFFSAVSLIGIIGAVGFYFLFTNTSRENVMLREQLVELEEKTDRLTNDKEILMARLVMAGKQPVLDVQEGQRPQNGAQTQAKEKKPGIKPKPDFKNSVQKKKVPEKTAVTEEVAEPAPQSPSPTAGEKAEQASEKATVENDDIQPAEDPFVAVEKFEVLQGNTRDELVVKFDIRNISDRPGGISGRIFTILKPEKKGEDAWVVVPRASLESDVPTPFRRGQYFSISRFKPVKFTIKNQALPGSFDKAAVYIFNDDGKLMFKTDMNIKEADNN